MQIKLLQTKSLKINLLILVIHLLVFLITFTTQTSLGLALDPKAAKSIAVTMIVKHDSLDQAWQGIYDTLKDNGYEENKNIRITRRYAQGSISISQTIAKQFLSTTPKPDAIVAISTPSAQSFIFNKDSKIPVVFSSVTDPVAAGLVKSLNPPTKNITGAIDFPPTELIIPLIKSVIPDVQKIGLIYNPGEANSVKTIDIIKNDLEQQEIKYFAATIHNSGQLAQAFISLVGKVEAIYIPSDNTVFSAMPKLVKLSKEHKIPIFSSDPDSVRQGVLACAGYSQYEVGKLAGEKLLKILQGEREIAISKPSKITVAFNKKTADILGIKIPSDLDNIEVITIDDADKKIIITVNQYANHAALDQAYNGLKKSLEDRNYFPNKINLVFANSQGNISNSIQIAKRHVSLEPKFMVGIATPSTQTYLKNRIKDDDFIAFLAVTDPKGANLVKQKNIIGITDNPPLLELFEITQYVFKELKTVGVIYNAGEINSVNTVTKLKEIAKDRNFSVKVATIVNTTDIKVALAKLVEDVDLIYIPQDNTVISALDTVISFAKENSIPVITNDPSLTQKGVVLALGTNYFNSGIQLGEMIIDIIEGKKFKQPIQEAKVNELRINFEMIKFYNISLPKNILNDNRLVK